MVFVFYRSGYCAEEAFFAVKYGIGSIVVPFTLISKCRCGPVDKPVLPTFPTTYPTRTFSPTATCIEPGFR